MMVKSFALNFTLNSGLDIWAHQTRNQSFLANLRRIRYKVSRLSQSNFYQKEQFDKSERAVLRKAVTFNLAIEFDSGFQFRSEQSALKILVKEYRTLSLSMREFIYSAASNYTVSPDPQRRSKKPIDFTKKKTFQDLSFAVAILSFQNHTGQQKIANRLGLTRQTICEKTKKNQFLHSQQCWLRVQNLFGKPDLTEARVKKVLKGFRGYRIGKDGWLYRQVTNAYRNQNIIIMFSDHKTFKFQNRKLNGSLFAEASKAGAIPISKQISWLRSKSRTKRYAKGLRDKKPSILNSQSRTEGLFEQHSYRTQILNPRTKRSFEVEHHYTVLKTPYGKLGRELHLLMLNGLVTEQTASGGLRLYRGTFGSIEARQYSRFIKGMKNPEGSKKKNISKSFFRNRNRFQSENNTLMPA